MKSLLASVLLLAVVPMAAAETVSPFESSLIGKIQCISPDYGSKTCSSMGRYERLPDGSFLSEDITQLSADPETLMTMRIPSTITGNRICQKVDPVLIEAAKITRDGEVLEGDDATYLRREFLSRVEAIVGQTFCMTLTGDDPLYLAEFDLDGVAMPSATTRMRLIGRDDGFRLRPNL